VRGAWAHVVRGYQGIVASWNQGLAVWRFGGLAEKTILSERKILKIQDLSATLKTSPFNSVQKTSH